MSDISWFQVYTQACHEREVLPDGWVCVSAKAILAPDDSAFIEAVGAVCPLKTRGHDIGFPNWSRRDRASQQTLHLDFGHVRRVRQQLEDNAKLNGEIQS